MSGMVKRHHMSKMYKTAEAALGGAMDHVAGVKRCIALFDYTSKRGESKFLKFCTLPLTGKTVSI